MKVRILLTPIHDPQNLLLKPLDECFENLITFYDKLIFIVSSVTSLEIRSFLKKDPSKITIIEENEYHTKAKTAFESILNFSEFYHWIDFDRILHWVSSHPNELKSVLSNPYYNDYTILGRTNRAYKTHPKSLIDCEAPCNYLASRYFGLNVDICVANIILSKKAVKLILKHSEANNWGILTEWPLIMFHYIGKNSLSYIEVEGNEWEDPDRYKSEIEKYGYKEWIKKYDAEEEWLKRLQNSIDIIKPLKNRYQHKNR